MQGASNYFGELGILNSDARKATVTAHGPLKCAKMDRARFERLLGPLAPKLKEHAAGYVVPHAQ